MQEARNEYSLLCEIFSQKPIILDIYKYNENSDGMTLFETPLNNITPGYSKEKIILPLDPGELQSYYGELPPYPPKHWEKLYLDWPNWRIELWHEFCHQIEDQTLELWKPGNDDPETYIKACFIISEHYSITPTVLYNLLE